MKMMVRRFSARKGALLAAVFAASCLPSAAFAEYRSSSDTAADVLDYIENERRAERENRLSEAQETLLNLGQEDRDIPRSCHRP